MTAIFLAIHVILAVAMIGVVLIQKSEGGGLGMGGGGMSGFMTGRSTANLLTRTTAILAAGFMATSIVLAILAGTGSAPRSIVDQLPGSQPASQQPVAPAPQPSNPADSKGPSVPLAQ